MDISFDNFKEEYKEGVAEIYSKIFSDLPYSENFTVDEAIEFIDDSMKHDGSICIVAKDGENVIGFSLGFLVPKEDMPTLLFTKIREMFRERNIDPDKCFFASDTAVLPDYQKKGIGTMLIKRRTKIMKKLGVIGIVNRTMNENIVKMYWKMFGKDNVKPLFEDLVKKGRTWYYTKLNKKRG